jgi:hypothetical protein
MRRNSLRLCTLALAVLVVSSVPAGAQTAAPGPYLATPAWDQQIKCDTLATCQRFVVLTNWNNEAVLDRETGLVWERTPSVTEVFWVNSLSRCPNRSTGGRFGWRLPTIQELSTLASPDSLGDPVLPAGHPFDLVNSTRKQFWSATTFEASPTLAWNLDLGLGRIPASNKTTFKLDVWCVRGGSGRDGQ